MPSSSLLSLGSRSHDIAQRPARRTASRTFPRLSPTTRHRCPAGAAAARRSASWSVTAPVATAPALCGAAALLDTARFTSAAPPLPLACASAGASRAASAPGA
eukprot:756329-Pleurochrysis_carterae.AAC.1